MCEFRSVMVFPQTCTKVCEGCAAGELCAMERREEEEEEEEEEEFGDTTLESAAPPPLPHFPPPDGLRARAIFSLARPRSQWPPPGWHAS